jgi:lipoprotein-anchoring transpeptidase ErfK/SrfK
VIKACRVEDLAVDALVYNSYVPSQFDRLSDADAHRQVGSTVNRAAGAVSGGGVRVRTVAVLGAAAVATIALAGFVLPSALAGGSPEVAASSSTSHNDDIDSEPATAVKVPAPKKTPKPSSTSNAAPIPATESSYAKHIPAYPPDGGHGRRIVYSKALMTVWIVDSQDKVVRRYPVTGRWDRPAKGTYHVYSMSRDTENAHSKVTFQYMVRFAWGTNDTSASIGFHTIPIYYADNPERDAKKGDRMTTKAELGLPVATGGCVRQSDDDAEFLYRWAEVGDKVVVLPTAN